MRSKLINLTVYSVFVAALFIPIGLASLTIGPSRWMANYANKAEWNSSTESNFQQLIILILLLISLFLAYKMLKKYINYSGVSKRLYLFLGLTCIAFSLALFTFKPEMIHANTLNILAFKNDNTTFEFGPYPDEEKLMELKKNGFDGVVSLLHPMVIPAEPILLRKEQKVAKSLNLKIISIPMLPWISENEASIKKIKKLAQTAKGKYYVHCNLGRDRAGLFKKIIEAENKEILVKSSIKYNKIQTEKPFERGPVFEVSKDVFFTSYPTDEEMLHYFLNSNIKTVVNLMNPKVPEYLTLIEKEKHIITQHNQQFFNFNVSEKDSDSEIKKIIEKIKKLPKPMVIHAFSSQHENSKKFLKLY